ncbi:MAG: molybdopterin-binding protein [Candidatus Thermoplasmatota archaeon]|nr:molybdopterin-binding protein [Candidatus Thermoplasmatota archaeon]
MVHKEGFDKKLKILILTVSTSRTEETDSSGESLKREFIKDSHTVSKLICKDDEEQIVNAYYSNRDNDVFIYVGGTGPSSKDVTVQSLRKISEKEMIGFGELFRSESHERLAYLSNSSLFIKDKKQLFCVPGSPDATKTAYSTISFMMGHIYHELHKE